MTDRSLEPRKERETLTFPTGDGGEIKVPKDYRSFPLPSPTPAQAAQESVSSDGASALGNNGHASMLPLGALRRVTTTGSSLEELRPPRRAD